MESEQDYPLTFGRMLMKSIAFGYITPEEALTHITPDLSHLRVWGCKAYLRMPRNNLLKDFRDKTYSGYFMGYSTEGAMGYK